MRRGEERRVAPAQLLLPKLWEHPHAGAPAFLGSFVLAVDSYQSSRSLQPSSSKCLQRWPKFKCMMHSSSFFSVRDIVVNARIP